MPGDDDNTPRRRSQRDRKQVHPQKRPLDDVDDDPTDNDDDDNDDRHDFTPKPRKRATQPRKRQRATKPAPRRSKPKPAPNGTETKIAADNALFNALLNPSAALQSTAEDFLHALDRSPAPAQADLINCILRACGSNDAVDPDQVVDYDGVVDALDNFTEVLKQENSPIYPLTSKLPAFKRFRAALSELIDRLVLAAAELGSLYTTDLVTTLHTWVIAMSSSQIRSFRHTATVVALELESALCQVAAAVEKEADILGRQREGDRKRKAVKKSAAAREKDLDGKAAEIRKRRATLAEFLKEIVDGVFVHRYRDLDPAIRAECVKAMAAWITHYPAHFLDTSYLRYLGWVLSDASTPVRLEAVRALAVVYAHQEYVSSLNHFTQRFKPRLLEMAASDTELAVRTAVIAVLAAIDANSLLEDDERDRVSLLLFDPESRVRKAVSPFVAAVWQEAADDRLAAIPGRNKSDKLKSRAAAKALAVLLVKWCKALDRASDPPEEDSEPGDAPPARLPFSPAVDPRGRIVLAVEALWDDVDAVHDWESILDVLLLDHSAPKDDDIDSARNAVDPAWRLSEVEETVLLEVLVASLRRTNLTSATSKKADQDTVLSDLTRALIKGLPRLFIKYQTDENRISQVLLIPPLMNLELYLEMRMMNAYASLWDDVSKQFFSHSSQSVLTNAVSAIRHFMAATSLTNTNSTKILELEDELATQLRDAVAGREEIEHASFTEDEALALGAVCARIHALAGSRDICAWMEDDEGGKQSSAWDIISALVDRGRLGYKEEERMVEQGLHLLGLHVIWKARSLPDAKDNSPDSDAFRRVLRDQRDALIDKLVGYVVGQQSNTTQLVKHAAFQNLMHLHILFYPSQARGDVLPTEPLSLQLTDDVQQQCAAFIQTTIEHYAERLEDGRGAPEEEHESEQDESSEEEPAPTAKEAKGKSKARATSSPPSPSPTRSMLEQEYQFMATISTFLRAIRAGAVHVRHGNVLLAHYGRLGPSFDLCTKVIIDVLREEGMHNDHGDVVTEVIENALLQSHALVTDGIVKHDVHTVALAKQLATSFFIRGAQLAIVRRLDATHVVRMHKGLVHATLKRIAGYAKAGAGQKRRLGLAVGFFRALVPLLRGLDARDALALKAALDQAVADARVEVRPAAKAWEPLRAYEKRLVGMMHKGTGRGRRAKGGGGGGGTSEEESGEDGEGRGEVVDGDGRARGEGEGEGEETGASKPPSRTPARPRPRPRPRIKASAPTHESNVDVDGDVEMDGEASERRPPRATAGSADGGDAHEGGEETAVTLTPRPSAPQSGLKRRREDENQNGDNEDNGEDLAAELNDAEVHPGSGADNPSGSAEDEVPPPSDETASTTGQTRSSPLNEFVIRRKRARH